MIVQQIENKVVREWFLSAQDDESAVESMLKTSDWPANTVCFLSQQMAEKSLKGFLMFVSKEPPKIHQLESILAICAEIDDSFSQFSEDAEFLSGFYVATRYPGEYEQFSVQEAREAFKKALQIKDFILKKILK